ncbi:MAG: hypothetical protein NVS4B12_08140 [Ktedonobacteraceae bacterium]
MTKLRAALGKVNAWQIRIVALSLLVVFIGGSSQVLVNAFAAGAEPEIPVSGATTTIIQVPTPLSKPTLHIQIRRAGADSFGGYTIIENR